MKKINTVNDWCDYVFTYNLPNKGCTRKQLEFIREYKELSLELARCATLSFFLYTKLGIKDNRTMVVSASKQRKFIGTVICALKKTTLEKQYEHLIELDIAAIRRRVDYIFQISKENIRLTKYYPYFEAEGFEMLLDFDIAYFDDGTTPLEPLCEKIEAWNAEHADEVNRYSLLIADEVARHNAYHEMQKAKEKAAKAEARAEKTRLRAEQKEIQKAIKEREKREKQIEKSYEHLYNDCGRQKKEQCGYIWM